MLTWGDGVSPDEVTIGIESGGGESNVGIRLVLQGYACLFAESAEWMGELERHVERYKHERGTSDEKLRPRESCQVRRSKIDQNTNSHQQRASEFSTASAIFLADSSNLVQKGLVRSPNFILLRHHLVFAPFKCMSIQLTSYEKLAWTTRSRTYN